MHDFSSSGEDSGFKTRCSYFECDRYEHVCGNQCYTGLKVINHYLANYRAIMKYNRILNFIMFMK